MPAARQKKQPVHQTRGTIKRRLAHTEHCCHNRADDAMGRCPTSLAATRKVVSTRTYVLRSKFAVVGRIEQLARKLHSAELLQKKINLLACQAMCMPHVSADDATIYKSRVSRHAQGVIDAYNNKYGHRVTNPFL